MSHALYLEDLAPGQRFTSNARTLTESDLTIFAMLSGDWNPVHVDAAHMAKSRYGQRILHGLLGPAIMTGMMHNLGVFDGSALAMLDVRELRFHQPLLIGQTVHLELEIVSVRPTSDGQRGVVDRIFRLVDSEGVLVQEMRSAVLVAKRPKVDVNQAEVSPPA